MFKPCGPRGESCCYTWECDPVAEGDTALYTSTTCGLTLTTKASYTWDGETSPEKESGYIRVFDADLTFEGGDPDAQCNVEAETGFFMAAGSARKSLSLSLYPSDPDAVFPEWFQYWWQHDPQPPPPYGTGLSLIGPGCVSFYSQPESGELLTDLSWGWEETEPYGFTETATPAQVYVQAVTPGTCTIQMGLGYNTWDSCWPPEAGAWDTVKVTVVDLDLTIDGVPPEEEEEPGGFIALGGSRKKILLSVLPNTVRPVKLDVTAAESKVELYATQTSPTPLGNHLRFNAGDQVPSELWVKGIVASDVTQDVQLTLDVVGGGPTVADSVNLTVLTVDTVEWSPGTAELTLNAYPDTAAAVGLRIYPDAAEPGGSWQDFAVVVVTTKPRAGGQTVHLAAFDPDDPSADNNEVDAGTLQGGDNRGGRGVLDPDSATTDAYGVAVRAFEVAHKPGDNHRVAAVVLEKGLLNVLNDNNVPANNEQVPGFAGKISPLLTVWRKLHLDLDSMGPITGNLVTGAVDAVEQEENQTKLVLPAFGPDFNEEGHFTSKIQGYRRGEITLWKAGLDAVGPLWVEKDELRTPYHDVYVAFMPELTQYVGAAFELKDDDWWPTPDKDLPPVSLPHTLNTEVLSEALAWAYVTVELCDWQGDSTFRVNVTYDDWAGENLLTNGTDQWWAAHVTAAFQGNHARDLDEEHATVQFGVTDVDPEEDPGDGSFVFLEVIRERASYSVLSMQQIEGECTAHEAGHQFALRHSDGVYGGRTYLMAGEEQLGEDDRDYDVFSPLSISKIRGIDHPIKDQ